MTSPDPLARDSGRTTLDSREPRPTWRKSSYSQGGGTECVEIAGVSDRPAVRDSKNPTGSALTFATHEWSTLLKAIKTGAHDSPNPLQPEAQAGPP